MKNKGFIKYELITVILLILIIFAFLFYVLLGGLSNQRVKTMKESAISFSKTVSANIASFRNVDTVYLGEAISEKVIKSIKNPVGTGECDISESKVHFDEGKSFVTLRCGKYLIDDENVIDEEGITLYKVGNWQDDKIDNAEVKTLYNCKKDGELVYPEYYEELYFIAKINEDNDTNYFFAKDIKDDCEVVSKKFYRTKEVYK